MVPPDYPKARIRAVAEQLLAAHENSTTLAPITAADPEFDLKDAYAVLECIASQRNASGWKAVGRKIGFTNDNLWASYNVSAPMWAHMWDRTVRFADDTTASVELTPLIQPRIEPEIVFKLLAPPPVTDDAEEILSCVEWMAAGFEIVQCHYPDWRFALPDCTASFALHAGLVVGTPTTIAGLDRSSLAKSLSTFEAQLSRGDDVVDRGTGANVLGSPALALAYLTRVLADQPEFPPLAAGEVVTTGTLTGAWPVQAGETWQSDYGSLGVDGLTVTFS